MKCRNFIISKHVLNRTIERIIKSQNIKLNKKQVSANSKKARKIIISNIENSFAVAFNEDCNCKYYYVDLKNDGLCLKYVMDCDSKCIITVIKDVSIYQELKNFKLKFVNDNVDIVSRKEFILCSYLKTRFNENIYLFVVNNKDKQISSILFEQGVVSC
jgi:hypothetical protein